MRVVVRVGSSYYHIVVVVEVKVVVRVVRVVVRVMDGDRIKG